MSPRFVLGRVNVPCVAEVVNRSLKANCTDFTRIRFQIVHFHIFAFSNQSSLENVLECMHFHDRRHQDRR